MFQILAAIPLICSIGSVAANNPYYPSKEFSASIGGSSILPLPSVNEADYGDLMMVDAHTDFSANLYYNDQYDYIITNIQFNTTINFYTPSSSDDTTDFVGSVSFTCSTNSQLNNQNIGDSVFLFNFLYIDNTNSLSCIVDLNGTNLYDNDLSLPFYYQGDEIGFRLRLTLENLANDINRYIGGNMGYNSGYDNGYNDGYANGQVNGESEGYQKGYTAGYTDADNQDAIAVSIFTGIIEVGLLPINVFLGILNFEVFGVNIGGFVASLMTVAIVVIVFRIFLGGNKSND